MDLTSGLNPDRELLLAEAPEDPLLREGVNMWIWVELTYAELVANHIATVRRLYKAIGEEFTPEAEAAMCEWLVENDRRKRPEHRYSLDDFGLSRQDIIDSFSDYEPRTTL